jgi:anti-sigma regulatory factor (Ser/Thr protein kinase)
MLPAGKGMNGMDGEGIQDSKDGRRSWERDLRDGSAAQAGEVRKWAAGLLADLHPDFVGDVTLVIEELLSNAYEHGGNPRLIRLVRQAPPALIRVEVEDNNDATPVVRERSIEPRGWGMRLIDRLAKDWGVESAARGKLVWAVVGDPAMTGERYGEVNTAGQVVGADRSG